MAPFGSQTPRRSTGLIGIGLMGQVIAGRLLDAGWDVMGWDVAPQQNDALRILGGTVARDSCDVFLRCDRIILSLPTHESVAQVVHETSTAQRAGQVLIDTSTGDPDAAVSLGESLATRHIEYLDATVSGSSAQLRERQAVFLVGATPAGFSACQDLFETLADKVYHTGPVGTGARMKLVTNLVLGLNRAALAEGLCFARTLGLDLEQTLRMLRESMAYSRIMDTKGEKMLRGDFTPQARLSQHLKDVRLMLRAAESAQTALPLTETHRQLLERAETLGLGELDNSAIIQAIADISATHETES
ncbi:MAG: NAD(P)-dependent oxidoreductase [Planctomycetota bacterium]|nr:NAD(P)-dependent oxidoreductase [Planctomycetota bacterium]